MSIRNGRPQTAVFEGVKSLLGEDINPALTIEVFKNRIFVRLFSAFDPSTSREYKRIVEVASLDRKYSVFYARSFVRKLDRKNFAYWDDDSDPVELDDERKSYIRHLLEDLGDTIYDKFDVCHYETLRDRLASFEVHIPMPTLQVNFASATEQSPLTVQL